MEPLSIYLLIINAWGMLFMLADKHRAKKKMWRIPEAALMGIAIIGGSLGILLGMYLFHHKTQRLKFSLGIPILVIVHSILLFWLQR